MLANLVFASAGRKPATIGDHILADPSITKETASSISQFLSKFIPIFEPCLVPSKRLITCLSKLLAGLAVVVITNPSKPLQARTVCDTAAERAARDSGVPLSVLKSITRAETGRTQDGRLTPWPWTVNMEGAGHWFNNRADAEAFITSRMEDGARSFDVGCFQINYKWHGHKFTSASAMFDPISNARYAAKFLSELYAQSGDWSIAAGHYHSRTPEYAQRYRTRFDRIHRSVAKSDPTPLPTASISTVRVNDYPLLQSGAEAISLGSLVPDIGSQRSALISLHGG